MNRNGRSDSDQFCCERLDASLKARKSVLLSLPKVREFGLRVLDGGSSCITLLFCPYCGSKFPESLSDRWFEEIERLGLEPGDAAIPDKYRTAEWWREMLAEDVSSGRLVTAPVSIGSVVRGPSTSHDSETSLTTKDHCCDLMTLYLESEDGEIPIRHFKERGEYAFFLRFRPPAFVRIDHCPWCGARLPRRPTEDGLETGGKAPSECRPQQVD